MNHSFLFKKGDVIQCPCGKTETIPAARILPKGWMSKLQPSGETKPDLIPMYMLTFVCPECDRKELEALN